MWQMMETERRNKPRPQDGRFSWFYAIDRSLKNNDQKDIPLDDRNWAEARDALIIERCARAGDMPFVTDLRMGDCDRLWPAWAEIRLPTGRVPGRPWC